MRHTHIVHTLVASSWTVLSLHSEPWIYNILLLIAQASIVTIVHLHSSGCNGLFSLIQAWLYYMEFLGHRPQT